MELLKPNLDLEESLKDLQQSIENFPAKQCIYNFSNYIYENYSLNDTEREYVLILKNNLYSFLEKIITKYLIQETKEYVIVKYIELILDKENKAFADWKALDLEELLKFMYDEQEAYALIKTFLKNCLIDLKNDYVKNKIAELDEADNAAKETIEKYNSEINDIKRSQEEMKQQKELLINSLIKKDDLVSLKEIKKDVAIQADGAPQGYKTQVNQTDGAGKDDIVLPVANANMDTSDLKTGSDVSTNTVNNLKDVSTNTVVESKEIGIGDETI